MTELTYGCGVPVESKIKFRNGWHCKQCGRMTEHVETPKGLVCCGCGSVLGKGKDKDELAKKQRDYRLVHKDKIRAIQRRYLQRKREKLLHILESSKMEAKA